MHLIKIFLRYIIVLYNFWNSTRITINLIHNTKSTINFTHFQRWALYMQIYTLNRTQEPKKRVTKRKSGEIMVLCLLADLENASIEFIFTKYLVCHLISIRLHLTLKKILHVITDSIFWAKLKHYLFLLMMKFLSIVYGYFYYIIFFFILMYYFQLFICLT